MIVLVAERDFDAGLSIAAITAVAKRFPGDHELHICVGATRMVLGPEWRCMASLECLAALGEFGEIDFKAMAA